jgi:hypothetical protein
VDLGVGVEAALAGRRWSGCASALTLVAIGDEETVAVGDLAKSASFDEQTEVDDRVRDAADRSAMASGVAAEPLEGGIDADLMGGGQHALRLFDDDPRLEGFLQLGLHPFGALAFGAVQFELLVCR